MDQVAQDHPLIVARLKGARDRKERLTGKCAGRKRLDELDLSKEAVALARKLAARRKHQLSLREISAELAAAGHLNQHGRPYAAESIASMLR
jgi:hypothetical protein